MTRTLDRERVWPLFLLLPLPWAHHQPIVGRSAQGGAGAAERGADVSDGGGCGGGGPVCVFVFFSWMI